MERTINKDNYESVINDKQFIGDIFDDVTIHNRTFIDVDFINTTFGTFGFRNCTLKNCRFINCLFGTAGIRDSVLVDCHFDNVRFANHGEVIRNKFIRVTGNIKEYTANRVCDNTFVDMDFDGFLPFYMWPNLGAIRWNRNYFVNTTISIDALKEFSKDVYAIASFPLSNTDIRCSEVGNIDVRESFDEPQHVILDISKMSEDAKLNIIASVFTKYQTHYSIAGLKSIKPELGSIMCYKTIPAPRPATIVDSRGYKLNPSAIQDISFEEPYTLNFNNKYVHDCSDLTYTYENSLSNPDNYSCYGLSTINQELDILGNRSLEGQIPKAKRIYGFRNIYGPSRFFDNKEELDKYVKKLNSAVIGTKYIIEYLGRFKDKRDVLIVLTDEGVGPELYAPGNLECYLWCNFRECSEDGIIKWHMTHDDISDIYAAFRVRGVDFDDDVYYDMEQAQERVQNMMNEIFNRNTNNEKIKKLNDQNEIK